MANLLRNPEFSEVGPNALPYYHVGGIPQLAAPHGWSVGWLEQPNEDVTAQVDGAGVTLPLAGQDHPFRRPESVVWRRQDAAPDEQSALFDGLPYVVKLFKGWSPIWCWLEQDVECAAGRYTTSVEVYPDLVAGYSGTEKVWADDPTSGEFAMMDAPWTYLSSGTWKVLVWEFDHAGGTLNWAVRFRGRHGLHNNGIFLRRPRLELVPAEAPPEWGHPGPAPGELGDRPLDELDMLNILVDNARIDMDRIAYYLARAIQRRNSAQ